MKMTNRTKKDLFSKRSKGQKITVHEAQDDQEEAAYVVDTIARQVMQGSAKESDFAIMYRTNAQSRQLEEAFRRANMNYRLVGAQRFYGRREVKDMIAFLKLIYNPRDEVSLARTINLPPRGVGSVTLGNLQKLAQQSGLSSGEVLLALGTEKGVKFDQQLGRAADRLKPFKALLISWREQLNKDSPDNIV